MHKIHVMKNLFFFILFILILAPSIQAQVVVIAHPDVPADSIEKSEIIDFYIGDIKKWKDGTSVVLFDLRSKSRTKRIFYNYIGKTSSRMKSIWMKNLLSGEGEPPETVNTDDEMIKKVAATPGALGFISLNTPTHNVKVLKIIQRSD